MPDHGVGERAEGEFAALAERVREGARDDERLRQFRLRQLCRRDRLADVLLGLGEDAIAQQEVEEELEKDGPVSAVLLRPASSERKP